MKVTENIYYGRTEEQMLDIYLPEADEFPVFVYFHGGGLEAGSRKRYEVLAKYLTDKGIAFVTADYRMYPTAVYPEFIRDAAAAVAWVKNNIEGGTKIYVGGSSAGGYLSMMLCFDKKYLAPYGIDPAELGGFVHDAGQPTVHFNVLRERGIDSRRVIVDEAAPVYHIGRYDKYAPMQIIVSDEDMENRYEQTMLMASTMKHFGLEKYMDLKVMHGAHCQYVCREENGESILGKIIYEFILKSEEMR